MGRQGETERRAGRWEGRNERGGRKRREEG